MLAGLHASWWRVLTARTRVGAHEARRRAGQHRRPARRSRVSLLAATMAATLLIAATAFGLIPDGTPEEAIAGSVSKPALLTSNIAKVPPAVKKETSTKDTVQAAADDRADEAIPDGSGTGKRIVFSKSKQRIWLINADGTLKRTYLVSGSIHDNVKAGSHRVELKTRVTTAYDYKSTLEYFVRFTVGQNAPIGFHDIPVDNNGHLMQTKAELGTPLSSGCVRQDRPDAIALWDFATVGTPVEVLPQSLLETGAPLRVRLRLRLRRRGLAAAVAGASLPPRD